LQDVPGFGETDPLFDDIPVQPSLDLEKPIPLLMERNRQPKRASASAAVPDSDKQRADAAAVPAGAKAKEKAAAAPKPQQDQLFGSAQEASSHSQSSARPSDSPPNPDNVLVITAVSTAAEGFSGGLLYRLVSACDLHFGDMAIFHRHEDGSDSGPVQFSMANAVNPGTFDLVSIDQMRTPAVTFFMSMEEPRDVMHAFECMLATAETLAEHLDGDLLDENRSVLRPQTKEHYRQRIRDFEMHNRSRRGARAPEH
jgi:cell division protein ZipA